MRLAVLLACLVAAACGTTAAPVTYTPTVAVARAPAAARGVTVGAVADRREDGREDARWIGTIRGGYGNPVKRLEADVPVSEAVRRAFADALAARGLQGGGGAAELTVTIVAFNANQYQRREATAEFEATLTDRRTGRTLWTDRARAYRVDGSLLALNTGVFASVEDLRRVALAAMSEAIDQLVDKPAFRAALRA